MAGKQYDHPATPLAPDLSPDAYARRFRTYQAMSGERTAMLDWLRTAPVFLPFRPRHPNILSVGCGPGNFDLRLLQMLAPRYASLNYVGLEPNVRHRRTFTSRLARFPLPGVRIALENKSFESYAARRRFDFVFMIHCLYYIPDRDQAIRKALSLLRAEGCLIIFNQTTLGIDALQRRFLRMVKGRDDERFSSRDLQAILDRRRIVYRQDRLPNRVDVSACFQPQSQAGLELLDFFLESDTRRLPPPAKRAILARLKTLCNRRNNSWLMNHPMAVFTVLKGGRKRIIFAGLKVDEKAIQNDTCAIEV